MDLMRYFCRPAAKGGRRKRIDMDNQTKDDKNTASKRAGIGRKMLKVLLWICIIWIMLLAAAHFVLSPAILTKIINRYAPEYVDGDISFGSASASVFTHFPSLTLTFSDFSVTYPSGRFDSLEQAGVQGRLMYSGCSEEADTLASFDRFSASIHLFPLALGKISIPHAELVKPRIFVHSYHDGTANWQILKTGGEDSDKSDDGNAGGMPDMILGKISMTGNPHIVYTDCRDTVFTMISIRQAALEGKLKTRKMRNGRFGFTLDSMLVAGRAGKDTVALGIGRLHIHEHGKHLDVNAKARTLLATKSFGRMDIPVEIKGALSFPKDSVFAVNVQGMTADIAGIPFRADADIRLYEGRTGMKGSLGMTECRAETVIRDFAKNFLPAAEDINTDALVTLTADFNGFYDHADGSLPDISARLSVPDSYISYKDYPEKIRFGVEAQAATDTSGKIFLNVGNVSAAASGLDFRAKAEARDLLGNDPWISIDGKLSAVFDSLSRFIPDTMDIRTQGTVRAELKGNALLSQLNLYKFSDSALRGTLEGKGIALFSSADTIDVSVNDLSLKIGPESRVSRSDSSRSFRMAALTGEIDSIRVAYKKALSLNGNGISFSARNSAPEEADTSALGYLGGSLKAAKLTVADASGSSILLDDTGNSFHIFPKKGHPELPTLVLRSRNKRIMLNTGLNRAILTDASVRAKAAMNTVERKARRKAFMDSLSKAYPGVPEDSLMSAVRKEFASRPMPEWMKEEDFRKKDIDVRLDETLAKYFREWDMDGSIKVRTGIMMTPYFPLRNILRGFECGFNNNEVRIDSMKVMAGASEITAKGKLTGLRRALLGRGRLNLDLDIRSGKMNAGELLGAYNAGMNFDPEAGKELMEGTSNSEFLKIVTTDVAAAETETPLIVIPSNLNARVGIEASDIQYSGLGISSAKADLLMKERCVQILNTAAVTNVGTMQFDGFYSTRTKQDLRTGFSLNLQDVTAEKVIEMIPAIDTLMPMLKSFKGLLACEMAATARLDTNMNVIPPSINGVVRIGGKDLSISDNELFRTLAKKLMFKNRREGHVQQMTVEGVIKDNVLEIFPFVVNMDRYTLAMSGIQNLDMSFRYHVSVLKSPLLFRLGLDLYGQDFDHLKFKIGKAKYKSTDVPVFSTVIDKTKINLLTSIKGIFEKGVEAAVKDNETQAAIADHKKSIGYVKAVDQEMEDLSDEERRQMEEQEAGEEASEGISAGETSGTSEGVEQAG